MKKTLTKEEKELLIKDLLPRITSNLLVKVPGEEEPKELRKRVRWMITFGRAKSIEDCLTGLIPYLRPFSDMTEEERKELNSIISKYFDGIEEEEEDDYLEWCLYDRTGIHNLVGGARFYFDEMVYVYDWLIQHHFDFRGLIEKGLAIKTEKGMYK